MSLNDIMQEYLSNGRLSRQAVGELRKLLASDNPYDAITAACDTGTCELSSAIAANLNSADDMVRWNAAASLFTRFRDKKYVRECINLATKDNDTNVRSIALVGLGELLPFIDEEDLRRLVSSILLSVLMDELTYAELRSSAYEGILAAMDVLPSERPSPSRLLNMSRDIDRSLVESFKNQYMR